MHCVPMPSASCLDVAIKTGILPLESKVNLVCASVCVCSECLIVFPPEKERKRGAVRHLVSYH